MRHALIATVIFLAAVSWSPAGVEPRLVVPDVCVLPDKAGVSVPVVLTGAPDLRPSSLRTTLLYDPSQVTPESIQVRDGLHVVSTVDGDAGRVDLVWHMAGRLPVPPLPAGVLARVAFRLAGDLTREPRLDLDPGETRSLDGNGRPSHVAVSGPATLVLGSGGLWLDVKPGPGGTLVESSGESLRGTPWILKGRSRDTSHAGPRVVLGELEPLATTSDGRLAADLQDPEPGGVFYYLAARDDGTGRPVLGFDSTCRPRAQNPPRAAAR